MKDLDKFYTTKDSAKKCVDLLKDTLDIDDFDKEKYPLLEPSAGDGAFLPYLGEKYLAMDIEPDKNTIYDIQQKDFLSFSQNKVKGLSQ